MGKEVELRDLIGLHTLSAVETGHISVKDEYSDYFEDCNYISFTLDGKTYTAVEDPSDGYRSSMRYLKVSKKKLKNIIPDTQVLAVLALKADTQRQIKCYGFTLQKRRKWFWKLGPIITELTTLHLSRISGRSICHVTRNTGKGAGNEWSRANCSGTEKAT